MHARLCLKLAKRMLLHCCWLWNLYLPQKLNEAATTSLSFILSIHKNISALVFAYLFILLHMFSHSHKRRANNSCCAQFTCDKRAAKNSDHVKLTAREQLRLLLLLCAAARPVCPHAAVVISKEVNKSISERERMSSVFLFWGGGGG